ncbi:hypothetical protein ACIQWB_04115 [Streptomyces olivaceus]|uniref:hypothetical protein n=1 Tax=Streptomyces olivaceus TaxID=47716 RepID=UPI00380EA7BD
MCTACRTGRALHAVAALATRWGWQPRSDGPGKTVRAVYEVECDAWLWCATWHGHQHGVRL